MKNLRKENKKEVKRWEVELAHQSWMNSNGRDWDFTVLFYEKEVGTGSLHYDENMDLEEVELRQLDFEIYPLLHEVMDTLEREYPKRKKYNLGGGLYSLLLKAGIITEEEE